MIKIRNIFMIAAMTLLCASLTACPERTKPSTQQPQQEANEPAAEPQPEDKPQNNIGIQDPDNSQAGKDKEASEGVYPEKEPESNAGNVGIESPDYSRAEKDKEAREELYPEKEPKGNVGIESPDFSRAEKDKEAKEELERRQEEARRQEEVERSGGSTYVLSDGTEVHTEHHIEDYINKEESYIKEDGVLTPSCELILDIEKMFGDVLGSDAFEDALGFTFSKNEDLGGVEFSEYDAADNLAHAVSIAVIDADGFTAYSLVKMFDCSKPANWWPADQNVIKVGSSYIHLDLAVLLLYGLEQAESNPRCDIFASIPFVSNFGSTDARHWQP